MPEQPDTGKAVVPGKSRCLFHIFILGKKKIRSEAGSGQKILMEEPVFAQLPSQQDILNAPQGTEAPVSIFCGTVRIEISSTCPQNLLQALVEVLNRHA